MPLTINPFGLSTQRLLALWAYPYHTGGLNGFLHSVAKIHCEVQFHVSHISEWLKSYYQLINMGKKNMIIPTNKQNIDICEVKVNCNFKNWAMNTRRHFHKYSFGNKDLYLKSHSQIFSPALTGVPLVMWLMLLSPPWSYIGFSCSLIMDSQTTEISQISQHGQLLPLDLHVCMPVNLCMCFYVFSSVSMSLANCSYSACFTN